MSKLKFSNQRHRHSPNTREHHADRHDPRQQQALVGGGHKPAAHHHPTEDKHEHHRLQESLQEQRNEVAASDMSIARQQGQKSLPVHSRKLLPVWCKNRFSKLGSEMCTSHNSTEAPEARLAISETSEPPRSAYTSALLSLLASLFVRTSLTPVNV